MPGSGGGQSARSNSFNQNNDRTTTTTPGGATVIRGDNGAVIKGDNGAAVIGGGSYTTKGGTTIGGAGAAGYYNGPNGATHVGGGGAAGITNGTESAGVAGRFSGTAGPNGGRSGSASGIAAATNGNGVTRVAGGTAAGARGPGGAAIGGAAGFNGQMQNGRFTGTAGSGSAIRGPAGNTWTNRNQAAVVNGQIVAGQHWNTVNGNFTHWNYFGAGWRGYYPNAWWPGQWAVAATAWTAATWAVAGSYVGVTGDPNYYDYNNGVSYQDGTVYYGDQPVAAADQYYREALDLALRGEQSTGDDWLPLGVFGFVSQGQQEADKLVQLAINKQGILRGNYQDTVSNQVTPVFGAVDKQTQKAAFMMTGNDSLVVETGLYNLTNDEVPVLVHYDAENQANRTLMRLKQPTQDGAAGTPAPQQQSSQQVSPQQPGPAVID
ncbi:MAG: hypothetical protein K8U03_16285 [Planctomycetia bacterium]|nr:hypothetical protein [Planctomycetia bacterium]